MLFYNLNRDYTQPQDIEMKRRTFFVKAGALFSMPLLITEIGCTDDNEVNIVTVPADNNAESFTRESSIKDGHNHTITILFVNVNNPPAEGNTITSSENSNHTHTIMLTQNDFQDLADGATITVLSSLSSGNYSSHSHSFSIHVPK